ncbi:MAG: biotin transporter BioY [Clostridia bacterium]
MKKISIQDLTLVALFAALIAVGAFIKIPMPYVPFTLQVLFTTLAGLLLGARRGALSVIVYVVLGLIGLPIFTSGGGISYVFNPTFGYLIGFIVGTYLTGKIAYAKKNPSIARLIAASMAGLLVVYFFGAVYYYFIANFYLLSPIGVWPVVLSCVIMVAPGNIVCCVLGCFLSKRLIPVIKRGR